MKKSQIAIAILSAAVLSTSALGLAACQKKKDPVTPPPSGGDKPSNATYTITFDANGGAFADEKTQVTVTTKADGTVELPTEPTKENYEFIGYNFEQNGTGSTVTATSVFTEDSTVYAQWFNENETPEIPPDENDPPVYDSNFRLVGKIGDDKEWDKDRLDYVFKPVELTGNTTWKRYQLTLDMKAGNSVKIRTIYTYLDELDCAYVKSFGADWGFNAFNFAAAKDFAQTNDDGNFIIKTGKGDKYTFTMDVNLDADEKICDYIITVGKGENGATVAAPTIGSGVYFKDGGSFIKKANFSVGTGYGDVEEWSAQNVTVKVGDKLVFGNGGGMVNTVTVKGNSGMNAFTVSGGEFTASQAGRFEFYYQPESGDVYINNVTPISLQQTDGVYDGQTRLKAFTANGTEAVATDIEIEGSGNASLTIKVGGNALSDFTLSDNEDTTNSGATLSSGVITVPKGKRYSFYYSVHEKRLSVKANEIIVAPNAENYVEVPATQGTYGYLVGKISNRSTTVDAAHGYKMTVDGSEYKLINVYLEEGDKVKVRAGNSFASGSNKIRGGGAPAEATADGYITINATGYYCFYYADDYDDWGTHHLCEMWLTYSTTASGTA